MATLEDRNQSNNLVNNDDGRHSLLRLIIKNLVYILCNLIILTILLIIYRPNGTPKILYSVINVLIIIIVPVILCNIMIIISYRRVYCSIYLETGNMYRSITIPSNNTIINDTLSNVISQLLCLICNLIIVTVLTTIFVYTPHKKITSIYVLIIAIINVNCNIIVYNIIKIIIYCNSYRHIMKC